MNKDFIIDFYTVKEYCDSHPELTMLNRKCDGCIQKRRCLLENRAMQIDSILHMDENESRFPLILKYAKKTKGGILYIIPAMVYKKVYGNYHDPLPCPYDTSLIIHNLDKIKIVYDLLSDEYSKLCYINVIMFRLTLDTEYASRAYSMEPQYFIKPFRNLGNDEVFVDCGAFIGDSYESYCRYNSIPRRAYLFEPDAKNIEKMGELLKNENVSIIRKGVYNSTGALYFVSGIGIGSYFSEEKQESSVSLEVTSIDEHITEDVSFIKMDIEGSEKEALIGAIEHIRSNYPKLAICIYHAVEHLWDIPLWINQNFPEYTNYEIRHHSNKTNETVLYVWK